MHIKASRYILSIFFWIFIFISFQTSSYAKIQDKTIINAVLSDNMADLQEILENGADPDARGDYGITALMVSINKYNDSAAEYLIKKGADVNASDIAGVTPLHLAARNGNMGMIKLLIENGADVKAKDKHGHNALYKAKLARKDNVVQYLSALLPKEDPKDEIKVVTKTYKEEKKSAIAPKPVFLKKAENYEKPKKNNISKLDIKSDTKDSVLKIETADLEWLKKSDNSSDSKIYKEQIDEIPYEQPKPISKEKLSAVNKPVYIAPKPKEIAANNAQATHVRKKKINVGMAKFNGPEQEEKMRIRYIDDFSNNYNTSAKNNWLIIFPNPKVKIDDAIFKAIYTIHNYRIKYVAVQNVRTGQKFIKAGPLVNKENAEVMCLRIAAKPDYFKGCNVHSINQR